MAGDPKLLIAFSHELERCAGNGLHLLDREGLLSIYRALDAIKRELDEELARRNDELN